MKLTEKNKKILNTFSMYLQSFGSKVGRYRIEIGTDGDVYWDYTYWSGDNTRMTIDSYDAIDNLIEELFKENEDLMLQNFSSDDRGTVEAIINTNDRTLSFAADVIVMSTSGYRNEYDFDDMTNQTLKDWLSDMGEAFTSGTIHYEGSGDSGYIESEISLDNNTNDNYPKELEDWMYRELEQYAGWENNEGSQGDFHFNFKEKTVILDHNENYETEETYEIPLQLNF